ncbi:fatty acyl-AMP ligase [Streptomyces orinoci]|uniref:Fatty acyl-AMP ligase n=1 Tax=Streptomyces orinoci TaxID=67339 RepID=A0ABV3K7X9_STRON|nr:fatty acyl-AMP ligase [Streptomyces orinoci]
MTITQLGSPPGVPETVTDALRLRVEKEPDATAFVFLRDGEEPEESLSYRQLDRDALDRAAALAAAGLSGRAVVLLYPSGLEFVRTLLGCLYAGVAAAPVQLPTRQRGLARLRRIADDAGTTTVLTTGEVARDLQERFGRLPELAGLTLVATDELPAGAGDGFRGGRPAPEDIALLQYTSGSTGDPKGVRVTHRNFLENVAETEELWPSGPDAVVVSWLPLFHDMGMLFGVMLPLCSGVPAYLMAPDAFVRRPGRWLEAVSRFRGTHAAAPNFAYELCVQAYAGKSAGDLDLSSWRIAANGAEPVRRRTIRSFTDTFAPAGFRPEAMCPGYGLAENTLKATGSPADTEPKVLWVSSRALAAGVIEPAGGPADGAQPLVSSGVAVRGTRVRIVDPDTLGECPPGRVGEIWIDGPCVADGYLGREAESERTFRARVAGEHSGPPHLRTGDLGFLYDGELYVTGRLKDVIIRKGRNYYPQDIELSVESAVPGLRPNCAAAFSVDDGTAERLVVAVEVDGKVLRGTTAEELAGLLRAAVHEGQRLTAEEIVLVRRGALPRTTSGKIQRRACRKLYLDGELRPAAPAPEHAS